MSKWQIGDIAVSMVNIEASMHCRCRSGDEVFMSQHGCLWISRRSRGIAKHRNSVALWLCKLYLIFVLVSCLDHLSNMVDLYSNIFSFLLYSLIIIKHVEEYQILERLCTTLTLQLDQI